MALNRREDVLDQYRDSSNLATRADLHRLYSTNPEPWPRWALDRIAALTDGNILEVGCGPGWLWRSDPERVPPHWRVTATDISVGMVDEARAAVSDPRWSFAVADVSALPFPSGSFDTVVANHMLYHVPDIDAALGEVARVLVSGGALVAATNGQDHFKEVRSLFPRGGRGSSYVKAFGLETGPPFVERHFEGVTVQRHPSVLEVPESEPVLRYITSMPTTLRAKDLALVREHVEDVIARDGVFRITTDAGIIAGRKR
jgi:SAM-dependent methyltransferase